ncbi:hypothetical protein O0L34_g6622 [Tuta absoluta]|nr:hypothetical protein O0L34_g6622 [Tuta absoluta]
MAAKTSDWRPGPTVCRCCFADGCYKDISTEYFWMGKREVYSEMLSDTFDVSIAYAQTSGPNSNSRLICEPCISRLRDASDFKRQVQECEKVFLQHLAEPGSSMEYEILPETSQKEEVKLERVKIEAKLDDDDDDFDDQLGFDDDDDDDMDDEPLTKFASKIPKAESDDLINILQLGDDTKKPEKRKSSTKVKLTTVKKAKKKESPKPSASKAASKPVVEKKKKAEESNDPSRLNAETLIRHSTAYPFRVNDKSILCVYCHELYDDPIVFRQHMDDEHNVFSIKVAFHGLPKSEFIKADCSELRCRLCKEPHRDLESVAEHLKNTHDKRINQNGKLGVMPYLLQKDVYNCAVCEKSFPSLFHLNRHTVTHFLSYVCHVCGSSYVATTGLLRHVRTKHQDYQVSCKRCAKTFPNMEAKERHRRTEKSCMPYCCPRCAERFLDWKTRKKHMETAHGLEDKSLRCPDCNIDFPVASAYYEHYKLQHSNDCAICKHCGMKFLSTYRLKRHLKRHNL